MCERLVLLQEMRRYLKLKVYFFAALFMTLQALAHGNDDREAYLLRNVQVKNQQSAHEIRCQLILAHFVTYDFSKLSSGQSLDFSIILRVPDRTLFFIHAKRTMAIENLLCGLDTNWSITKTELPLALFQTTNRQSLVFECVFNTTFLCNITEL